MTLCLSTYPPSRASTLLSELTGELIPSSVDPAIINITLRAFGSLLTQGTADIAWPNGQPISIGGSYYLVSPSSSGKSWIYQLLYKLIERLLDELIAEHKLGENASFFIEDASRGALIRHFLDWRIGGLFSDEAGIFATLLKEAASLFAKLISGNTINHARVSTGRARILEPRFCMFLVEQPDLFQVTKKSLGAGGGSVGVCNRLHFAQATKLPDVEKMHRVVVSDRLMTRYSDNARKLLTLSLQHGAPKADKPRPVLQLTREAKEFLEQISRESSSHNSPSSPLYRIREYVSRHTERTLREAGALHVQEFGPVGEVSLATLLEANAYGHRSIETYYSLTYEPPRLTKAEYDAQALWQALLRMFQHYGIAKYTLKYLQDFAPSIGLTRYRFNQALPLLAVAGFVTMVSEDNVMSVQVNVPHAHQLGIF